MDRERQSDLIQRSIDGDLSNSAQAELDQLLASNEEAAELYASLEKVARLVEQLEESDPPAALRRSITESVRTIQPSSLLTRVQGFIGNALRNGGEAMNKKWATAAVCVVALVAIVAYFGYWNRPDNGEAVGAIGAVEKHRAEQIGDQDVMLGDEAACEDCIPYGDMLESAAMLQNAATELGGMSQLAASATASGLDARMKALSVGFGSHVDALNARMLGAMRVQLGAFDTVLASQYISMQVKGKSKQTRVELNAISGMLEAKVLEAATLESAVTRLSAIHAELAAQMKLEAYTLEAAQTQLGAFNAGLENKALAINQDNLRAFDTELEAVSTTLEARQTVTAFEMLGTRQAYLEAMNLDMTRLRAFSAELGKMSQLEMAQMEAMTSQLEAMGKELQSRAALLESNALMGMKTQLEAFSLEHMSLDAMSLLAISSGNSLEARAAEFDTARLGAFQDTLGAMSSTLEARQSLAARMLVGEMKTQLGATQKVLAAEDFRLGAMTLDNLNGHVLGLSGQLEAHRTAFLESATLEAMTSQLGAVNNQLEARRLSVAQE
jgi:hypothetical protein